MRLPNDLRLAEAVPGIDLVLGGVRQHGREGVVRPGRGPVPPILAPQQLAGRLLGGGARAGRLPQRMHAAVAHTAPPCLPCSTTTTTTCSTPRWQHGLQRQAQLFQHQTCIAQLKPSWAGPPCLYRPCAAAAAPCSPAPPARLCGPSPQAHNTAVVKSGTDFREFSEISLTVAAPAAAPAVAEEPAGGLAAGARSLVGAAGQLPGKAAGMATSLPDTVASLPGAVASLPSKMASGVLAAHQRCSKWARLAGIPALAGCNLSASGGGGTEDGSSCGDEPPHCLHSPRGGGDNATPEGRSAALVYEAAAEASLATSLLVSRPAGGSAGGDQGASGKAAPPQLTVQCLRHVITSELPEDPEVAAIVQVRGWEWLRVVCRRCSRWACREHCGACLAGWRLCGTQPAGPGALVPLGLNCPLFASPWPIYFAAL